MDGGQQKKGQKHIGVNTAVKDLPFIPTLCKTPVSC